MRTWEATAPETNPALLPGRALRDVKQTTAYFDGLGRPLQTVVKQGSLTTGSSPVDLVSANKYDDFGREQQQYLPFGANATGGNTSTSDGLFKINPFQQQVAFYNTQLAGQSVETNVGAGSLNWAYGQTTFESSPLNRVVEAFAPGSSWVGTVGETNETSRRSIKTKHVFNTAADDVKVWTVTDVANNWGTYAVSGVYAAGTLYKTIAVDEHNKQVIEFKDNEGQVVLKRVQLAGNGDDGSGSNHTNWLNTYYVYDNLSRLRLVIPSQPVKYLYESNWFSGTITSVLTNLCFRYEYDTRGRMIRKKVADAEDTRMVYDARDRVVMTQTGQQRYRKQWMYTRYDDLNRPVETGLFVDDANYDNLAYHLSAASASISYPDLANYEEEIYTNTFYDNYNWKRTYTNSLDTVYNNSYDQYFLSVDNAWPYAQENVQSFGTKGLVTGTRNRVLGSSSYLFAVNIYDNNGRLIQVQETNITGEKTHTTTQYSWSGAFLVFVNKHFKAGTNAQNHTVVTKMSYDDLGRLTATTKAVYSTVNGQSITKAEQVIAKNEYDALGQLKSKKLGQNPANTSLPMESMEYEYNIRGWSLGANHSYLINPTRDNHYFGFELAYDKPSNCKAYYLYFTNPQYNGNITGGMWKSKGDNMARKFDYSYDVANRLTRASFNQQNGTAWDKSAGIDFSVSGITYDANGNILTMKQVGWTGAKSETIDSLVYTYSPAGNKLRNVIDYANNTGTVLGDFRSSTKYMQEVGTKTSTASDYVYDGNGSMVRDRNKDLGDANENGIVYNSLNLPSFITVNKLGGGYKGRISYIYDGLGNKLRKIVYDSTVYPTKVTTTTYLAGAVYENDTLQFIGHEEGRLRLAKRTFINGAIGNQFQYDYFLKDHLGNVRMVLTEQTDTANYMASMEALYRTTENKLFYNIAKTSYAKSLVPGGYPADGTTNPNDSLARTNGSGNKVGPALVLKVMSGDRVQIGVKSFYKSGGSANSGGDPVADILSSLASGIVGASGTAKGTLDALGNTGTSPLLGAMNAFRGDRNPDQTSKPKAYLNWILLDEQLKYEAAGSGAKVVGNADVLEPLTNDGPVAIPKNGYLYIYVSNETQNWDVFFDNLSVQHIGGPIMEETHYYPFGLTMAGISTKALKGKVNKFKFNGGNELQSEEFSDQSGLELYDASLRSYDPQIGRFHQIDPLADFFENSSPYVFALNNPILMNDPLGLAADTAVAGVPEMPAVIVTPENNNNNNDPQVVCLVCDQPTPSPSGLVPVIPEGGGTNVPGKDKRDYKWYEFFNDHNPGGDFLYELNQWNPLANFVNGVVSFYQGEDTYGRKQDKKASVAQAGSVFFGGFVRAAGTATNVVSTAVKTTGWVKRSIFNTLDPAIKKKVAKAISKGIVDPKGKSGIIKLTQSEIAETGYLYKVKILGHGGDIRIYGNPNESGHIIFDWISGH